MGGQGAAHGGEGGEYAARGGLDGAVFAWGDEHFPGGQAMANSWQGDSSPWQNLKLDGYEGTSPVGGLPPNRYGLYEMTGNVWEWTTDAFTPNREHRPNGRAPLSMCLGVRRLPAR